MDCETCRGSPIPGMVITRFGVMHCPNHCIGRIASCCDAAGSAQPELRPNEAKAGDTSLPPVISPRLGGRVGPNPRPSFCAEP
jgi:hypothetical protein